MNNLYEESKSSSLVYYQGKDSIRTPQGGSPHGDFKVRFNDIAAASLGADGRLPVGSEFNNGALIVKEVFKNGVLDLYAVMKKDPESKFAASKWVWAEFDRDGKSIYNVSRRGSGCTGCHTSGTHRDLVRIFDLH